jgi:hypothetical protein
MIYVLLFATGMQVGELFASTAGQREKPLIVTGLESDIRAT